VKSWGGNLGRPVRPSRAVLGKPPIGLPLRQKPAKGKGVEGFLLCLVFFMSWGVGGRGKGAKRQRL